MEGPPHKRKYIVGVEKHNSSNEKEEKYIGFGIGNSHKEGQQNASKMALIIYGLLEQDQYLQTDIYYPSWDKINSGDTNILGTQTTIVVQEDEDDLNSDYSEKSVM